MAKREVVYLIYNIIACPILLLAAPFFVIRNLALRRPVLPYFLGLSRPQKARLKDKQVVWLQAVSVEETFIAERIIKEIKKSHPDFQMVVTTTFKGQQTAKEKLGELALVTCFPLDIPFVMKRFIMNLRPVLFVMVGTDIWPNAVFYCEKVGSKIAVVNGRIGNRSYQNYSKVKGFMKIVFEQFDLFAMQSVHDANRIGELGAPLERITVTGNAKFDREYPEFSGEQLDAFRRQYRFQKENLLFTAAGTYPGEEAIVVKAYLNLLRDETAYLIIAPTHPNGCGGGVAELLEKEGLPYIRRSTGKLVSSNINRGPQGAGVLLWDTLEALDLAYAVSDVVLAGGSLVKIRGAAGYDVIEAAVQEKLVIYGPFMDNFPESKALFEEVDAGFTVRSAADITSTILKLVADRELYGQRATRAKKAVLANRGAIKHTIEHIDGLLRGKTR